jgi:hypothetical protein
MPYLSSVVPQGGTKDGCPMLLTPCPMPHAILVVTFCL